jgi:hypothetical protein
MDPRHIQDSQPPGNCLPAKLVRLIEHSLVRLGQITPQDLAILPRKL